MSCHCDCSAAEETKSPTLSRRSVVAGAGVGAAALSLSACGGGEKESSTDAKGPASPTDFGEASAVPVGGVIKAVSGDIAVMISQPTEGTFKAFSSVCTHQGCQLNVIGKDISCPCHASKFKIEDGAVVGGPAPSPLPEFPVEVKDGRLLVG